MNKELLVKKLLLSIVCLCTLVACGKTDMVSGNGKVATEHRSVDKFNEIAIYGNFVVDVVAGLKQNVQVVSDSNILPFIKTEVDGHTLKIKMKKGITVSNTKVMSVSVHVPKLQEIESMGANRVIASKVESEDLDVEIAGATKITLSGKVKDLVIRANGASEIDASLLHAKDVAIRANGATKMKVNVEKSLQVKIAGSGKVGYLGNPTQITQKISGSGVIQKIGK